MKALSKVLLVGAVAVMAIAVSAAPSEAAKKKAKAPAACVPATACTMAGTGVVHHCGVDGKRVAVLLPACTGPGCPPPCM